MDLYLFSMLLGFLGLAVMAVGGVLSHGHGGSHHGHSHHGHDVGDVSLHGHGHVGHHLHAGPVGHAGHVGHVGHVSAGHVGGHHGADGGAHHGGHQGHDTGHHHGDQHHHGDHGAGRTAGDWLLSLLSPRLIFSVLVGLGATGLLAREWLGGPLLFGLALAGGVVFEKLLVGPFWNFLFRFGSEPAHTLESAVMDTATAVTGFDGNGQGLVKIELDGQVVQLLATLRQEDRAAGHRIRTGDAVLVEEVDGARNRCTVSWTGTTAVAADR